MHCKKNSKIKGFGKEHFNQGCGRRPHTSFYEIIRYVRFI